MKQNTVKLNESQLRNVVAESVLKVLNEIGDTPKGQYMLGRLAGRKAYRDNDLNGVIDTNMHAWKQHKSTDNDGHGVLSNDFKKGVSDEKKKQRPQQSTSVANESILHKIVSESVRRVLKESYNKEIENKLFQYFANQINSENGQYEPLGDDYSESLNMLEKQGFKYVMELGDGDTCIYENNGTYFMLELEEDADGGWGSYFVDLTPVKNLVNKIINQHI